MRVGTENTLMAGLLGLAIARLWIMPLRSGFAADEAATLFVIRYGAAHPSLAAAPQLAHTPYYLLPRLAVALGGYSEVVLRIPSLLALAVALYLIARLAARLIHPEASWFAAFLCLAMQGFDYQAAEARPYALGTAVVVAAAWFLVRWMDEGRLIDAVLFVVLGALLWPIQLVYWSCYPIFIAYAIARLAWRDSKVGWLRAAGVFAALAVALLPTCFEALALAGHARDHVITSLPGARELFLSLRPWVLLPCWAGAWLLGRVRRWTADSGPLPRSSVALIVSWWLAPPLGLFLFSWLTGVSLFVPRYFSPGLPGLELAGTMALGRFLPVRAWKPLAAAVGLGALIFLGQWRSVRPAHSDAAWRGATRAINARTLDVSTPVICPSPFVEARSPVWKPGYSLPSVLYSYLVAYPLRGRPYPLPFDDTPDAERYMATVVQGKLAGTMRFFVYGYHENAPFWVDWLRTRPELAGWHCRRLGNFREAVAVEFDAK